MKLDRIIMYHNLKIEHVADKLKVDLVFDT